VNGQVVPPLLESFLHSTKLRTTVLAKPNSQDIKEISGRFSATSKHIWNRTAELADERTLSGQEKQQ
jgi:hypothetical protein